MPKMKAGRLRVVRETGREEEKAPMMRRILPALFLLLVFQPLAAFSATVTDVSVSKARGRIEDRKYDLILDVRTPEEYTEEGHLRGSILIPIRELDRRIREILRFKDKRILVYCAVGGRSARAAGHLAQLGFSGVENMLGGIEEWKRHGFPVEKK